ncbi:hypothetical protein EBT11_06730 [bacterium]|nr:hypothetical protein [bacterium]
MFKETALILAGHGSTQNADSSRFTRQTAHRIRERGIFGEVRSAFWKEQPSYADAVRGLSSKKVVVVPWFLANGYFTTKILKREFAEITGVECRVTEPIGARPEILGHLQKRAKRLLSAKSWKPHEVTLLVASHGTPLHAGSRGAAVLGSPHSGRTRGGIAPFFGRWTAWVGGCAKAFGNRGVG